MGCGLCAVHVEVKVHVKCEKFIPDPKKLTPATDTDSAPSKLGEGGNDAKIEARMETF